MLMIQKLLSPQYAFKSLPFRNKTSLYYEENEVRVSLTNATRRWGPLHYACPALEEL